MSGPQFSQSGSVLQSGIPWAEGPVRGAKGLLLRGVVTATYVIDHPSHPYAQSPNGPPLAIYCDVLAYTTGAGNKFFFLPRCLVSQDIGGMQRGHIWKPRATSMDVTGNAYSPQTATNPANMDGDHVLVGFLDDELNQPVILRGIPHPSTDLGHTVSDAAGHRLKLVLADGDPNFIKHHGTFYGVSNAGDFVVDTTLANDGTLSTTGAEPPATVDGSKGNHLYALEQHAKRLLQFMDMTNPSAPNAVMTELVHVLGYVLDFMANTPSWQVKAGSNNVLQATGSAATTALTIGNGAVHVSIAEHLQALWTSFVTIFDAHIHPTPSGPSSPTATPAPNWNPTINSTHVSLPDG